MKLRNTAIALGIGAATATGLSLLKVNKDLVVGSTAVVVVVARLMIALKDNKQGLEADINQANSLGHPNIKQSLVFFALKYFYIHAYKTVIDPSNELKYLT